MCRLSIVSRGAGPFKMLSVLAEITSRGAALKFLAEPVGGAPTHELGEVLAALVGYIARKTREDILGRTAAGRERARLRGVRFGAAQALAGATKSGASPPPIRRASEVNSGLFQGQLDDDIQAQPESV